MLKTIDKRIHYPHSERMKTNQSSSPATSTPKHTSGPWRYQPTTGDPEDGFTVCTNTLDIVMTGPSEDHDQDEANCRLVAASPELFDAADGLIEFINAYVARLEDCNGKSLATDIEPYLKAVEEALAKATAS